MILVKCIVIIEWGTWCSGGCKGYADEAANAFYEKMQLLLSRGWRGKGTARIYESRAGPKLPNHDRSSIAAAPNAKLAPS